MRNFEIRNQHFDRLVNSDGLRWLGQNTNHFPTHPAVREALVKSIDDEEFHAYAPPAGLEELRALIVADLGLEGASSIVTDGAIAREGFDDLLVAENIAHFAEAAVGMKHLAVITHQTGRLLAAVLQRV